jgi:hypothetical protein
MKLDSPTMRIDVCSFSQRIPHFGWPVLRMQAPSLELPSCAYLNATLTVSSTAAALI